MSDNSLNINSTETSSKRRSHSNTISGGRPPALDMENIRPPNIRRNSEGSPHLPPPICISEPTPIEPSSTHDGFFNDNKSAASSANSSRPSTPNSDASQAPPPRLPKGSATAPVGGLLDSPGRKKKNCSRASSLTSNLIHEIKESSTIQNLATDRASLDNVNTNTTSGSIAGVSLATTKKNEDFHALFRSVPEDDNLIEDFGCALQKEILLQGRCYISESYLCFNANIFGWVTNLVIAFEDIIDIEKKSTAIFIPNAIQVTTENAKHFFASFLSRDQAYDLMVDVWRNARPDLIPAKDGESKLEDAEESDSFDDDDSGSYYDSDTEDSYTDESDNDDQSLTAVAVTEGTTSSDANRSRKPSMNSLPTGKDSNSTEVAARRRAASELPPRPRAKSNEEKPSNSASDAKNESADGKTAEKPQVNEKQNFYDLFYEGDFMKTFLVDNQKSLELTIGEWRKGEGDVIAIRDKTYIKPLNGAIGPKQTKCVCTEEILHKDFDNSITALTTTCTPDVPSGGSFSCKTKTCMTWAGKGKVRIFVTVLVDFTKSSWLKSTIEKASIDGQTTYYKELDAAIRAHAKENPSELGGSKPEGRRRRKGKRSKHRREPKPEVKEIKEEKSDSAVHRVLGAISNAIADIITGAIDIICSPKASHLTLICLVVMVFLNIFIARKMAYVEQQLTNFGQTPLSAEVIDDAILPSTQHRRDYNRQEEDDLWDWLGRVDPDKSSPLKEKVTYSSDNVKEQEVIWDNAIQTSKSAKDRLDKHMAELSEMIKKAESNLEQVTQAVNEQRKKIQQD
ncbi:unnamed protein product [Mucor hiemalis]